jgi:hypothetical protein
MIFFHSFIFFHIKDVKGIGSIPGVWRAYYSRESTTSLMQSMWGEMSGGVYRLKYHLAKIPGNEVEICPISSAKLVVKATKALEEYAENKKYTEAKKK